MYTALTIAGSDCSGGAGIQADIKTMCAHGVYAMSAITALTAQNTTGVTGILDVGADFLARQLDAVFTDIVPDAVKIGMLPGRDAMQAVARKLTDYQAQNIVLDPVMVSTSGSRLMDTGATDCLKNELFPLATLITPNVPETQVLTGMTVTSEEDMVTAGLHLYRETQALRWARGLKGSTAVLVKGGHCGTDANDVLITARNTEEPDVIIIRGTRIVTENTHGTGCTLSSAIASNLAKGIPLEQAVRNAKEYLTGALAAGLNLGHGSGPVQHLYALNIR